MTYVISTVGDRVMKDLDEVSGRQEKMKERQDSMENTQEINKKPKKWNIYKKK